MMLNYISIVFLVRLILNAIYANAFVFLHLNMTKADVG